MLSGVLLLNKASGVTSHDCVSRVRRLIDQQQVGHVGTLDPRAKGLLPLCLGSATKLSEYLFTEKKRYQFTVRLGISTNTQDMDGEIMEDREVPELDQKNLDLISQEFVAGPYYQETPDFSARKVNGMKLYQYARTGQDVPKVAPRLVQLESMTLKIENKDTLWGEIVCSTGTYVRQLSVDIASKLGTVGVLFDLVRTEVGPWNVADATDLETLESDLVLNPFLQNTAYFIPSSELLSEAPRYEVSPGLWQRLKNGVQPVQIPVYELKAQGDAQVNVGHGDLICGIVNENTEKRLGALLSVHFVKNHMVTCRLQKLFSN